MKKLFILSLLFCFLQSARADSIDYWHIHYNGHEAAVFHQYKHPELNLARMDVSANDSISLRYFRDTPCEDCETRLVLQAGDSSLVLGRGRGTFQPVHFKVNQLLQSGQETLHIWYEEGPVPDPRRRLVMVINLR
jgi:hypothetical protein